ncbi:formyltetrahydrofolate deformylase [Actinoplanes campanulatus]|uniref:Formyltetrahydrofolate deformylase n=1 Tax=Actinoplanes campanulatus TaxID=113559 RepID=A0A7W5FGU9_9ACTN|nr:formyltetrahydrofolate deformylase [Actinoplanes campanulatus]MBB3097914.1 formyltetrahydrofolate deformylase [Actinoplanes campanulatus]GGN22744.1 hypothetical protein GCM10010109_37440 [Actinoplanes campanulatus]GID34603.1 hypothetical protein Aca09nite_11090 [Actinoplanes campanulatus]
MIRPTGDLAAHVRAAGRLVVQPRMGIGDPARMAAGIRAVARAGVDAVATITVDSYTRVGDAEGARDALRRGALLNGFPLVTHGPAVTAEVAAVADGLPVQVRHGSAAPEQIFRTLIEAGLSASEGGPVSYCLPYGRTPLAESVAHWRDASQQLQEGCEAGGRRAHLETFGGCLLGQLCPPSLLVAMSVLEGLFFVQQGVRSISLSYAQQTDPVQDIEAMAALRRLAGLLLPPGVDWHVVLYGYMGVFPSTAAGAVLLTERSAQVAARGGADRLIVKTAVESLRLPTVAENVAALRGAARTAAVAGVHSRLPDLTQVDCSEVLAEATALVDAVLALSDDVGTALRDAFAVGLLDVPYCLHRDNLGRTRTLIEPGGRLAWADRGGMPLPPAVHRTSIQVASQHLLRMLRHTADEYDHAAVAADRTTGPEGSRTVPAEQDFVLTLTCPDRRAIARDVTGFLAEQQLSIVDSRQFADVTSEQLFMRVQMRGECGVAGVEQLRKEFEPVADRFGMRWQLHDLTVPHRAIIMVSRHGHCLNDLLFRVRSGALPIEVPAVVSNHPDLADMARWHGVPFHHIPVTGDTEPSAEAELTELIELYSADTVVLTRYMRILSPQLCARLEGRLINIRRTLLPGIEGADPYQRAHVRGVKVIGATAHYVTADLGEGPIIEQDFVRADHRHTPEQLATLDHDLQASALARAVKWHAERRVILDGIRTVVFS